MKGLFDATKLNNIKLKNRFVRSATWENMADEKGHLTDKLRNVYKELAQGGVGLIITGYSFITENEQPNPGMMGIYDDSFIDEYKELTDMIHDNESKAVMQIVYGGSKTTFQPENRIILGASKVENLKTGVIPKKMTKEDIENIINAHGQAAERVKEAGFNGVQIHAAHGYFLNQFLSPYYNRRDDKYGGSINNRGRIISEIYDEIRTRVGDEFAVLIKVTAGDFVKGGQRFEDCLQLCKQLDKKGIDGIEMSGNIHSSAEEYVDENWYGYSVKEDAYFKDYGEIIAEEIDTPVMLVGGLRKYNVMEELLQETEIDYFSLCRPLMAEPELINRWQQGDNSESICTSCSNCYSDQGNACMLKRE